MRLALYLCCALLPSAVVAQTRTVAITVDDLICTSCAVPALSAKATASREEDTNKRLIAGLRKAHVPATGFVITRTVEEAGHSGLAVLLQWLNAGFDLGSHTYSHPNFAEITTEQEETEVARADRMLRPLLKSHGRELKFFRFPYNDTGDTQLKHDALAAYLKQHGYQLATCTIETEDYTFAAAYLRAKEVGDAATAQRIRRAYLDYSATEIDFYVQLNKTVLRYESPQVMLIHDSLLNADTITELLELFRQRGYRFVTLGEAQADPAYAIPDTYVTKYGPMWGYRWAIERRYGHIPLKETEPPAWVSEYAEAKTH